MSATWIYSVYKADSWALYPWQAWWLKKTTTDYRHIVVSREKPPMPCDWVECAGDAHADGLAAIASQPRFRCRRVVIFDSDAMPVHARWQEICETALRGSPYKFIAPVRYENYDAFPHISFLYTCKFEFVTRIKDLIGVGRGAKIHGTKRDVGAGLPMELCYPLMRSNRWNPHPIAHAIYGNIIYHRGGGSRRRRPPFMGNHYWATLDGLRYVRDSDPTPAWINLLVDEKRFDESEKCP